MIPLIARLGPEMLDVELKDRLGQLGVQGSVRGDMKEGAWNDLALDMAVHLGPMVVDRLIQGIWLDLPLAVEDVGELSFKMVQAARLRSTRTDFISCPGCGRTLFDIQATTDEIRRRTGHLPGVAVAVMGCIVNGVGEMADADFGYVGQAPGLVDLYLGKTPIKRSIPNDRACDELIALIKREGKWIDPPVMETIPSNV